MVDRVTHEDVVGVVHGQHVEMVIAVATEVVDEASTAVSPELGVGQALSPPRTELDHFDDVTLVRHRRIATIEMVVIWCTVSPNPVAVMVGKAKQGVTARRISHGNEIYGVDVASRIDRQVGTRDTEFDYGDFCYAAGTT